ncbi:MAG: hypothetical protein AAF721_17625 [Myxococcota bacterium]
MSTAVFGLTGLGVGCVITTGDGSCDECGGVLCHSQFNGDGDCVCDPGYEWEDPNDNDNFECNPIPGKDGDCDEPNSFVSGSQCFCDDGFNWCSDDPNDFTCCEDPMQAMTGGNQPTGGDDGMDDGMMTDDTAGDTMGSSDDGLDDTTDGGLVCEETPAEPSTNEPLPEDCTEKFEGAEVCSNTIDDGSAGSRYWQCIGGEWVEMPDFPNDVCVNDGFDFAAGCFDDGAAVQFDCGIGPGTDCSGPECSSCVDSDIIQDCISNKLNEDSCFRICTEEGDGKMTFDFGECIVGEAGPECACCDDGDEGCNIPE